MSPPKDEPWAWHSRSMLESPAWRALSINGRRLLEFLELDHLANGGAENGRLMATYSQLTIYGLTREHIYDAISEAEALGFLQRTRPRQMRVPMTYRLTYYGSISEDGSGEPPTNEWKKTSEETVARIIADRKEERRRRKRRRTGKQNSGAESTPSLVRKSVPDDDRRDITADPRCKQNSDLRQPASGVEIRTPSISRVTGG